MTKLTIVPPSSGAIAGGRADQGPQLATDADNGPAFNEQFGIRIGRTTYYINLRIGTESRAPERLAQEGQVRVNGLAFLYCVICSGAIMLFGTLCIIYLMKSGMGINLSDGNSVLHPIYEMAGGR
jgi:hypothetical protein